MIFFHSIEFPDRIFRINPAPDGRRLALELRDKEARRVRLCSVDLEGNGAWEMGPELDWWSGLEAVRSGGFLVHNLENPSLPVHRGLEWWDSASGEIVWRLPEAILLGQTEDRLWVRLSDQGEWAVELKTGTLAHEMLGEDRERFSAATLAFQERMASLLQHPVAQDLQDFSDLPPFHTHPPVLPQLSALALPDRVLIAWHSLNKDESAYQLWLASVKGDKIEWVLPMEQDLDKLNPEPFFLLQDKLIWLQGPQKLCWKQL